MEVIYSSKDLAGTSIAKVLSEEHDLEAIKTDLGLLYSETELSKIDSKFLVFASKHKSESGSPALTVHVPGNWNLAEMGGKPQQLSWSEPIGMKAISISMEKERKKRGIDIKVCMEVDHHGPLCEIPCCFAEIGSTEKEWKNDEYAKIVGTAIANADEIRNDLEVKEIALGVGGGHYCPAFNRIELEGSIAISHVMPNYAVDAVSFETFMQALERTSEKVGVVLIDWKGLKAPQREKILKFANEAGIEWRKT